MSSPPIPGADAGDDVPLQILKAATDAAVLGAAIVDSQGDFRYVNQRFAAMHGYQVEEIIGQPVSVVHDPETKSAGPNWVVDASTKLGESELQEYWHLHRDGTTFPLLVGYHTIHSAENGETYIAMSGLDLASILKAQKQKKYQVLFEEMLDAVIHVEVIFDDSGRATDYRYLSVNPAWERARGVKAADVIGKTLLETTPDIDRAWVEGAGRVAVTGEPIRTEVYYEASDRHFRATGFRPAPGECVIILQDITETKRAEQAYQTLFDEMLDGFAHHEIICDDAGKPVDYRFLSVNSAFEKMVGMSAKDVVGKTVLEILPDTESFWIDVYGAVALTGEPRRFENFTAGLNKHFEVTAYSPAQGEFATIFQDITERIRSQDEAKRLEAELARAQKLESVGRLAGSVAHDFNNMLTVILGHAEQSLDRVGPDEHLSVALKEIHHAAESSAALTRQLLAFAHDQPASPEVVNVNDTIAAIVAMLRRLMGDDIELSWRPGESIAPVLIDPTQIDQILVNLCLNARDAIDNSGSIAIETKNVHLDEAFCKENPESSEGDFVEIVVTDDGSGMDEETQARLFEPFFTTKNQGQGTGLGLSTVYGVVRQNGGCVTVTSEPGNGATFIIYLPQHVEATAATQEPEMTTQESVDGETILLVEDESAILRLTTIMLESRGYSVLAAPSPREALRMAEEHRGAIDLLLTDVIMPEMSGRTLATQLMSSLPDLKCLFMSGYTGDVTANRGGLDDDAPFIAKPFSQKDLADKVRETLDT